MSTEVRSIRDDESLCTLYYSPAYAAAEHAFDTPRKSKWIHESLEHDPIPGLQYRAPAAVDEGTLSLVHDQSYIEGQRGLPIAFSIGGGYVGHRRSREQLIWLHRLTLEAAAVSAYAGGTPVSGGAP